VIASIVKNLKRVMAAEYSRELSVKVHAGACRVASLGFKQGGAIGYALQRELVDEDPYSRGILSKGQRKHLQTDGEPDGAAVPALVQGVCLPLPVASPSPGPWLAPLRFVREDLQCPSSGCR
jgi:hypothetical protein